MILLVIPLAALVACAGTGEQVTFAAVTESPGDYDGQRVTVEAGYYGAFEVSVLTSGFAESFPPQPVEPLVWVGAGPSEECLEDAEGGVRWAERVEASGVFRYDAGGGFGHLGAYEMTLQDAEITCL
ncbi:MAG: hypothetical protein ACRDHM_00750 [Actinomycetota bacterium]